MSFPASTVTTRRAFDTIQTTAAQLKVNIQGFVAELSSRGADYDLLRAIYRTLTNADAQFETLKTTPGLQAYARAQVDDNALDIVAEFNAMQGAIASAEAWMETNVPVSNRTLNAVSTWGAPGTIVGDTFTAGQTAGLRTELNAVIATIG